MVLAVVVIVVIIPLCVSADFDALKVFSRCNTSFFQAFYDVVISFSPPKDRRAQKNLKYMGIIMYYEYLHTKIMLGIYFRVVPFISSKK